MGSDSRSRQRKEAASRRRGVPEAPTVLLAGGAAADRDRLARALRRAGYEPVMAADGHQALALLRQRDIPVAVLDVGSPRLVARDILPQLTARERPVPAVVLVRPGDVGSAVAAMKLGAFDCLPRPVAPARLLPLLADAIRLRTLALPLPEHERPPTFEGMVGVSRAMREVFTLIGRVAPTDANVLLQGESGTGKELVAQAIHARSRRRAQRFLAVNCAAIPAELLENEFFGHERGAFTGALERRAGAFELAHGGTLFLDEIDEMPVALQAKLLRVLEEKRFRRLGGREEIDVDVRIIAATDKIPEDLIRAGRFKEELFFRLNVMRFRLAPLRERREDIPLLVRTFLTDLNQAAARPVRGLSPEAWRLVLTYPWPGNVRDLRNAMERAAIAARGPVVLPRDLPPRVRRAPAVAPTLAIPIGLGAAEAERRLILATLEHCRGNRSRAAGLLGIGRRTLQKKLRAYGTASFPRTSETRVPAAAD